MATTQIQERPRVIIPRAGRGNEIIAIILVATGILLSLCLVSAAFYPNDPSWNSVGQSETRNWAGFIGANVAATALQFVGLAAYLLPVLLFASAWRRFRSPKSASPSTRIAGLVVLVVAVSALLSISHLRPLFDSSVQPGGLLGAIVAESLASGLNRVGATVILVAIAATGVLLATNLSFVRLYQLIEGLLRTRFAFVGTIPEKFRAWQQARSVQAQIKKEAKAALKAEREAARANLRQTQNLSAAERVADFMKEPIPAVSTSPIKRV
ncbi:MAG TPA: DNA translocase FtsK 4TM domain-containing protein, partial [Pyrinomonadaceae bacterium]